MLAAYGFDSAAAHETANGTSPKVLTQLKVDPFGYYGDEMPGDDATCLSLGGPSSAQVVGIRAIPEGLRATVRRRVR